MPANAPALPFKCGLQDCIYIYIYYRGLDHGNQINAAYLNLTVSLVFLSPDTFHSASLNHHEILVLYDAKHQFLQKLGSNLNVIGR
jgi:hypothetical protein